MSNYNLRSVRFHERWDTPSPLFPRHVKIRELVEMHRVGTLECPIGFTETNKE